MQAEATALAATLGKTITETQLEVEPDVLVYIVILSDNNEVKVDAKTGQIVTDQGIAEGD